MPLLLGPLGGPELLIVILLVVVFFGAKKLPQLGAGLGKGIRNFKHSVTGKDESKIESPKEGDSSQSEA